MISANRRLKSGNGNYSTRSLVFFVNGSMENVACVNLLVESVHPRVELQAIFPYLGVLEAASGTNH